MEIPLFSQKSVSLLYPFDDDPRYRSPQGAPSMTVRASCAAVQARRMFCGFILFRTKKAVRAETPIFSAIHSLLQFMIPF